MIKRIFMGMLLLMLVIHARNVPTLSSIHLESNATTVNVGEMVQLSVVGTYSDGSNSTVDKNITYTVTPTENAEVNGSVLPPEPDPTVNNATLLGVDVNDNGVRDDVERKVYTTYPKAIERAVMMQAFRAEQKMLADPDMIDNAKDWEKEITKFIDCGEYLYFYKKQIRMRRKDAEITSEWQFNNKERVKLYMEYNKALSGGVYDMNAPYLQACTFDVERVLELDK